MQRKSPLPIDNLIPDVFESLRVHPNLVIEAAPGAGKTTRVPAALLGIVSGHVLVLEPRRIAARLAAKRAAAELGQEPGLSVGYQVRFERIAGSQTRLHFLTEGVFTRRLLSDPELNGVDAVVLDEFHERHLETDLALALLKRVQQRRPQLHIIVMSATLDARPVAAFLNACPVLRSEGVLFSLAIEHQAYSPTPLHEQVRDALDLALLHQEAGDVLVFLPGAAEIRRVANACREVARKFGRLVLPLYSDLPPSEQDRAVTPGTERKVILSTNIAESSITIEGVRTVIDSGLARIATHSPWTGLPTLTIGRISKASARQRAGRAARTAPGRVIRLYSEMDLQARSDYDAPEIQRSDLIQFCLALRSMGIRNPYDIKWLDAPPEAAVESAERLLDLLVNSNEAASSLVRLPLHPRLARMISAGLENGVGREVCAIAALLSSGERAKRTDLLETLEEPMPPSAQQQLSHLLRLVRPSERVKHDEMAILRSVLAGFPDRVAQRQNDTQFLLANGVTAEIAGEAVPYSLIVALGVEDRTENATPILRLASRVEPEWLLDLFPQRLRDEEMVLWNRQAERVDAVSRLLYEELVLEESTKPPGDTIAAAELLAKMAIEAGIERFMNAEDLNDFHGRVEFAGMESLDVEKCLSEFCVGIRSFAALKKASGEFIPWLENAVGAARLRTNAPRLLKLKAGRQVKVHYEPGKTPWIASRLQDFFGMEDTPRIGPRNTPVVIQLLAPNQRAVQTTTDLAGFWIRLYPQVRRELMRRYPRHRWPENYRES